VSGVGTAGGSSPGVPLQWEPTGDWITPIIVPPPLPHENLFFSSSSSWRRRFSPSSLLLDSSMFRHRVQLPSADKLSPLSPPWHAVVPYGSVALVGLSFM